MTSSAELHADGFVDGISHITLDGTAELTISNGAKQLFTGTGDAVISERGLSICTGQALLIPNAPAQFATLTWGLTLPWGGTTAPVCGTDRMRTVNATATQARAPTGVRARLAAATTLTLPAASAGVLAIAGRGGAPAVSLRDPHGQTITDPRTRVADARSGVLAFAAGQSTYVLLAGRARRAAGAQRRSSRTRSPESVSPPRSRPSASRGRSAARAAHPAAFHRHPEHGQRLVFFEQGPDIARAIGSSAASHGALTFTPARAASTGRTVSVIVEQNGIPRAQAHARALSEAGRGAFPTQAPVVLSARRSGRLLSVRITNPNRFRSSAGSRVTASGARARRSPPPATGSRARPSSHRHTTLPRHPRKAARSR